MVASAFLDKKCYEVKIYTPLEKMMVQFSPVDILGLTLFIFAALWGLYSLFLFVRRPNARIAAVLIGLVAVISVGIYIFLTASTPARRAYINVDVRGSMKSLLFNLVATSLALIIAYVIYWIARRLSAKNPSGIRFAGIVSAGILLFMLPVMLWLYTTTFAPDLDEVFTQVDTIEEVIITDDIPIHIFENQKVKAPTALELGPNNELYVAGAQGSIWVIQDTDQDNLADNVIEFASGLNQPEGLAWGNDGLYINEIGRLIFMKDNDGDYVADETTVILDGFPGEKYAFHQNNGLTFGPDGRLYIGSGSTTDHRPEEDPLAARVLSINPDGSDLQVYATGVRNPFGLIPAPGGGFFAVDNGSSGCVDTESQTDDCRPEFKIDVPEEVNYILEGKDYGFPTYFGMPPEDSDTMPPIVTYPEHTAPSGIELYTGDKLPARFKGQLFVSLWARGEIYRIKLYRIDDEHFTGASLLFASGLTGPSAILNTPDGGLYVASYSGNAIYYIG
jgi:putative membrane-bound dehydrogenase-like protein